MQLARFSFVFLRSRIPVSSCTAAGNVYNHVMAALSFCSWGVPIRLGCLSVPGHPLDPACLYYASLSSLEYHETLEAFYRHRGATGMPSGGDSSGADAQEDRPLGSPGDAAAASTAAPSSNYVAVGSTALAASASGASSSGSAGGKKELSPLPGSPLARGLTADNSSKHGGSSGKNPPTLPAAGASGGGVGDAGEDAAARVSAPMGGSSSGTRSGGGGGGSGGMASAPGGKAVEETWWVMHEVTPMGTPAASVQPALSAEGGTGGGTGGTKGAASATPGTGRSGTGTGTESRGGGGGAHGKEQLGSRPHRKKLSDGDGSDTVPWGRASNDAGEVGAGATSSSSAAAAAGFGDGAPEESGAGASPSQAGVNHGKGLGKRRLYESNNISKLEAQMRSSAKVRREVLACVPIALSSLSL